MRPWEETWTAQITRNTRESTARIDTPGGNGGTFGELSGGGSDCCGYYAELDSNDTDIARAKLAAAAPDLYRALERALYWIYLDEQKRPQWNGNRFDDKCLAEAALRKARGE